MCVCGNVYRRDPERLRREQAPAWKARGLEFLWLDLEGTQRMLEGTVSSSFSVSAEEVRRASLCTQPVIGFHAQAAACMFLQVVSGFSTLIFLGGGGGKSLLSLESALALPDLANLRKCLFVLYFLLSWLGTRRNRYQAISVAYFFVNALCHSWVAGILYTVQMRNWDFCFGMGLAQFQI